MTIKAGEGDTKERFSLFSKLEEKKKKKEESECGDGVYE